MVGVLRLLHGKTHEIVTRKFNVSWRCGVQSSGQIARKDRPVRRLITQLDADFSSFAVDEFGSLVPADQRHVVTRHQ